MEAGFVGTCSSKLLHLASKQTVKPIFNKVCIANIVNFQLHRKDQSGTFKENKPCIEILTANCLAVASPGPRYT